MSPSRSHSITTFFIAGLACPLIIVALLAGLSTWANWVHVREAETGNAAIAMVRAAGDLVHRLQLERAASVGAVNSTDGRFADLLPGLRTAADAAGAAFNDIGRRIQDVQRAVELASGVTSHLVAALHAVEQSQQAIAAAMEEQHATSGELARSVQQAAERVGQVDRAVEGVVGATARARQAVESSRESTKRLTALSAEVAVIANRFRTG